MPFIKTSQVGKSSDKGVLSRVLLFTVPVPITVTASSVAMVMWQL